MVEQAGALGYFGDARRAAVGTELLERVTASGSLVIRKLGATGAGELAIHRFLSAPSVSCREMLVTLAGSTLAATARRHIVVAQDTTEINFAGRGDNRRGLGAAGDGVSAGVFLHTLVAVARRSAARAGPIAAGLAGPAAGFGRGFSSIPWSSLTARRRLLSVCSTHRSGPVPTRS